MTVSTDRAAQVAAALRAARRLNTIEELAEITATPETTVRAYAYGNRTPSKRFLGLLTVHLNQKAQELADLAEVLTREPDEG
ncbi:MAG: hypothetical protein VW405_19910 [Rhodospirillaceae bacterium]